MDGVFCSLDDTDCKPYEPIPFISMGYSHKFNGPGLTNDFCLSIHSGNILLINGPYSCGINPGISIFKNNLFYLLQPSEQVIADSGYRKEKCIWPNVVPQLFSKCLRGYMHVMGGL